MGSGLHNELVARQYLQCSSPPKSDRPANCHATIFCCLFRIIVLSDLAAGAYINSAMVVSPALSATSYSMTSAMTASPVNALGNASTRSSMSPIVPARPPMRRPSASSLSRFNLDGLMDDSMSDGQCENDPRLKGLKHAHVNLDAA